MGATNGPASVITISASYGAGGSVIAPAVAERLGVPLLDRLVSADLAHEAEASGEGLSPGEEKALPHRRFFSYLALSAPFGATPAPPVLGLDEDDLLRSRAEAGIAAMRRSTGGVILGRAGAVVLAHRPSTYHVRLDGPVARRVAWAAAIEGIDLEAAGRRQVETDRARIAYVRRLYRADATDASLYHLVLDTTVLPTDRAIDLIVTAAQAAEGMWTSPG